MFDRSKKWGWIEFFILVLYFSSGLLLLPGTQAIRFFIRLLPYAASLGMLALYLSRKGRCPAPPWNPWLNLVGFILVFSLLNPETPWPAGPAQCLFQLCIMAPTFWAYRGVSHPAHLNRIVWLVFLASAASAAIGALQVYYPDTFMPKAFSHRFSRDYLESLTFTGAEGQKIVRPPGLSDLPGGAAIGAATAGFLGIILSAQPKRKLSHRLFCVAMAALGMFTLYLTHVRVFFLVMLFGFLIISLLRFVRGRVVESGWIGIVSTVLVIGAFAWATRVGGEAVAARFLGLREEGVVKTFESSRWHFMEHTFKTLLPKYPLGAGVGRWGMMHDYFGSPSSYVHAEVQITGWLLDGGVPMWVGYGFAILGAMGFAYRVAMRYRGEAVSYLAGVIFCMNLFILGATLSGPCFNTTLGSQFWLLNAVLYGAVKGEQARLQALSKEVPVPRGRGFV